MLLTNLNTTNSNNERELITRRAREEELSGMNERYKQLLTQTRDQVRKLEENQKQNGEGDVKKLQAEIEKLVNDNRSLKSRLFDVIENEKRLKAQLSSGGGNAQSEEGTANKLKQCEAELDALRKVLETKEAENKELVNICDELLKDCEELKQQNQQLSKDSEDLKLLQQHSTKG